VYGQLGYIRQSCRFSPTGVGVTGEVGGPLDVGAVLELAGGDSPTADGTDHTRIRQLRLGGDDAVGDVMVDGLSWGQTWIREYHGTRD